MGSKRWILTIIIFLTVLGFTAFMFLQAGADKKIVDTLIPKIENRLNAKITFEDVSVSLTSVQLKNVTAFPIDKKRPFFKIEQLGVNVRVGPLLYGELDITGIRVDGLKVFIGKESNGASVLEWKNLVESLTSLKDNDDKDPKDSLKIPEIFLESAQLIADDGNFKSSISDFKGRITPGDKAVINAENWTLNDNDIFSTTGTSLEVKYDFKMRHLNVYVFSPSFTLPFSPPKIKQLKQNILKSLQSASLFSNDKNKIESKKDGSNSTYLDVVVDISEANGTFITDNHDPLVSLSSVNSDILSNDKMSLMVGASGKMEGGDSRWAIQGQIPRDGQSSLDIEIPNISLSKIGKILIDTPVVDWTNATTGGQVRITHPENSSSSDIIGQINLSGITLKHEKIAKESIKDISFLIDFNLQHFYKDNLVNIGSLVLSKDLARLQIHGSFYTDRLEFDAHIKTPPTSCRQILGAFPKALKPLIHDVSLEGQIKMDMHFALDIEKPEKLILTGSLDNRCKINTYGSILPPNSFRRPFAYMAYDQAGDRIRLRSGPGSNQWTPLSTISPFVIQALLTTEDGKFDRHNGLTLPEVKNALKMNLKKGGMFHGASTITMQLAKNLFLSRERTLSRKLQELFFTWYLESNFTKDEILELYLNVVEFGPSLYGISDASMYYFGRRASELNLAESVFLIKLLPNPISRHNVYNQGKLSDRKIKSLHRVMEVMKKRDKITNSEYQIGLREEIVFYKEGDPIPAPRDPVYKDRIEALDDETVNSIPQNNDEQNW